MAVSDSYLEFVLEQLRRVAPVTSRRMFGAVGLYSAGHFFGIVDEDRLYFKVDETTRADYEREGMEPFRPFGDERSMHYYEVPAGAIEEPDELRSWLTRSLDVAARSKKKAPARKKR